MTKTRKAEILRTKTILTRQVVTTVSNLNTLYSSADGEEELIHVPGFLDSLARMIAQECSISSLEDTMAILERAVSHKAKMGRGFQDPRHTRTVGQQHFPTGESKNA